MRDFLFDKVTIHYRSWYISCIAHVDRFLWWYHLSVCSTRNLATLEISSQVFVNPQHARDRQSRIGIYQPSAVRKWPRFIKEDMLVVCDSRKVLRLLRVGIVRFLISTISLNTSSHRFKSKGAPSSGVNISWLSDKVVLMSSCARGMDAKEELIFWETCSYKIVLFCSRDLGTSFIFFGIITDDIYQCHVARRQPSKIYKSHIMPFPSYCWLHASFLINREI